MSTELQTSPITPTPGQVPEPSTGPILQSTSAENLQPSAFSLQPSPNSRRLKGKIPSLPKAQRDTINALLLDGATYARVAQHMAHQGVSLNGENISNWYQTGFQDYLADLERLEYQRAKYESAGALLQDTDTAKLPEAGLQTAAAQIYDLLGRFTPAALAHNMAGDPDRYTRLLNALFRLSRETLALQKNRDARAQAQAATAQSKDPNRKLNESETRAIVRKVDEILGFPSPEDDEPEPSPSFTAPEPLVAPKSDGGGSNGGFAAPQPLVAPKSDEGGSNGGFTMPEPSGGVVPVPEQSNRGFTAPKPTNGEFTAPEPRNGGFIAPEPRNGGFIAPEPLVAPKSDGGGSGGLVTTPEQTNGEFTAPEPGDGGSPPVPPSNDLPPLLPMS